MNEVADNIINLAVDPHRQEQLSHWQYLRHFARFTTFREHSQRPPSDPGQ